jgi:hypothetical protein
MATAKSLVAKPRGPGKTAPPASVAPLSATPARVSARRVGVKRPKSPAQPAARHDAAGWFRIAYDLSPVTKIDEIRRGIPAARVRNLSEHMGITQAAVLDLLGLARSSVNHKVGAGKTLAKDESELVLGVESLIGQVAAMIAESGDPAGFDPAKWIAAWIGSPNPALGGSPPAAYMDTVEGQKLVSSLLARSQSGAYS